jgi:Pyridoxamine 5'-phosphate oxidase
VVPDRQIMQLTRDECLTLLGGISFGRIIFTSSALPAVRPVRHLLLGEHIIIRASLGAAIDPKDNGTGTVVAYEADVIEANQQLAWSVVVVGRAYRVASETLATRYREVLRPSTSEEMDELITISSDLVTGYRMTSRPTSSDPEISTA